MYLLCVCVRDSVSMCITCREIGPEVLLCELILEYIHPENESAYQRERSKLHAYLHTYLQLKYVCINRECVKVCESPYIYLYCSELRILLPLSTVLIHSALSETPFKSLLDKITSLDQGAMMLTETLAKALCK